MIPKSIKQVVLYNDLLIPKEHREAAQLSNVDIWNSIKLINSSFPKAQIVVEHTVKEVYNKCYTLDMKLKCRNPKVQKLLDEHYERHMCYPMFLKEKNYDNVVRRNS